MSTPEEMAALKRQLDAFGEALHSDDLLDPAARFYAADADFLTDEGIVRGQDGLGATDTDLLRMRASAEVVSTKWLAETTALVDTTFDADDARGWSTELWNRPDGGEYVIRSSRTRAGVPFSFDALSRTAPVTLVAEGAALNQAEEEAELKQQFRAFRKAFNEGDTRAMVDLWSPEADALPVFSFLNGRAQGLTGRAAVGDKADRMSRATLVSNPDPTVSSTQGASLVSGEPKTIRFLSSTLAVVDGTAEISNIPRFHGLVPSKMKGVYTDVWRKVDGKWRIESSRPWF